MSRPDPVIRIIETEREVEQYKSLIAYCFNVRSDDIDRIFPLDTKNYALGYFEYGELSSALISYHFDSNMWGSFVKSSGIGAVATNPEYRNKGYVNELFKFELRKQYQEKKLFSVLYPFSFSFYRRYGYGSLGQFSYIKIDPDNIKKPQKKVGCFKKYGGSAKEKSEIYRIYNSWTRHYDFGIARDPNEKKKLFELSHSKDFYNYLYLNSEGELRAFINFELKKLNKYQKVLEVKKVAWETEEDFLAIVYFLYCHRDQCKEVHINLPKTVPLELFCKEPRIEKQNLFTWMARPIDVLELLRLKTNKEQCPKRAVFTIQDDVIPENTGTYIIDGDEIEREDCKNINLLSFDAFSSLLFGAYSVEELIFSGEINGEIDKNDLGLFKKNENIYLSEFF